MYFPGKTRRKAELEHSRAPTARIAACASPLPAIPGIPQALVSFSSGPSHLSCDVLSVISDCEIPFIPKRLEVPSGDEAHHLISTLLF